MVERIRTHEELEVYALALQAAMRIFELTRSFPQEERYSLTDQMRRSSRSVCANLAEAWRKRRYQAAFVSKLSDVEAETAEIPFDAAQDRQAWLRFSAKCGSLEVETESELSGVYDNILGKLVNMIRRPCRWLLHG